MLTSGYSKKMRSNFISIQILCNIQHFANQFSIMVALVSYVKFVSLEITNFCDFLFIYMKLNNLEKQANYILNYIYKKENTRGHSNIVSLNKCDSIQISCVVLGQLQV